MRKGQDIEKILTEFWEKVPTQVKELEGYEFYLGYGYKNPPKTFEGRRVIQLGMLKPLDIYYIPSIIYSDDY